MIIDDTRYAYFERCQHQGQSLIHDEPMLGWLEGSCSLYILYNDPVPELKTMITKNTKIRAADNE